uniref:AB hydrolase-1 domain-containing protein n=1 Tax=Emiliania huxleyi TaxID=2903 RepID=A0A7S3WMX9_EMIHU
MAPRLPRALSLAILTAAALAPAGALTTSRQTVRFKNRIDGKEVSLSYRKFGSGQSKIVMIMGTAAPQDAWQRQVDALSHSHQVCVFDNRGVGSSSVPDGPYSTEAMAEDTIALMDHLGWRRAHIVGFSLGGMVAMKLASLNRHRIKSLALISTHTGGFFRRLPTVAGLNLLARIPFVRSHESRTHIDLHCHYNRAYLDAPDSASGETVYQRLYRQYLESRRRKGGCRGLSQQVAAVMSHRMSAADLKTLREADVPKLVAHGDRDVIIHPSNAVATADAIDADLEIVDSNHMSVVECADQLNQLLDEHVTRANAKARAERSPFRLFYRAKASLAFRWRRAADSVALQRASMSERVSRLRYYRRHYLERRASKLLRASVLGPATVRLFLWAGVYTSLVSAGRLVKTQAARRIGNPAWLRRLGGGVASAAEAACRASRALIGGAAVARDTAREGASRAAAALRGPAAAALAACDPRRLGQLRLPLPSASPRLSTLTLLPFRGKSQSATLARR